MTKNILILISLACCIALFYSCDEGETYGDKKNKERATIASFIENGTCVKEGVMGDTLLYVAPINVISEETFAAQDSTTNVEKNEYVLLSKTGIYMQIVNKGCGEKLTSGQTATIYNRFVEFNLAGDSIQFRNNSLKNIAIPDEMTCTNSYGKFTGSFLSGIMKKNYSSVVPEGWLVPLAYINLGRIDSNDDELATVRLIVPHTSGNSDAQSYVYACFYEITYERGREPNN